MALYEVVREIENSCERNQMRDIFFEEIETDDPLQAVKDMLKDGGEATLSLQVQDENSLTVFADCSGMIQKFLFTKI